MGSTYKTIRHAKKGVITLLVMMLPILATAQQRFPVTATTVVNAPNSPYLSDYTELGSNLLSTNFVFNDFNESTWNVHLKITIESTSLRIQTRPGYIPTAPITVTPGVSVQLSGGDLADYLNYDNITITGIGAADLQKNGRLPEGLYTFCIEVLDFPTGKLLSNISCATVWINLNDPPKVISPLCGTVVDPNVPLNIPFQWQLSNSVAPNSMGAEYRLVVYEVTDPNADPFTSVNNGKVLQIFESDVLPTTSFLYDLSAPPLDVGRTYVYQIAASDISGRDLYKNDGLSEVCWFHYGYPEGGKIKLESPTDEKLFANGELQYFKWGASDKTLDQQNFSYKIEVTKINEGQTPEQALTNNTEWHSETTREVSSKRGLDLVLEKKIEPAADYAWRVIAFTEGQEIASSEIWSFKGPPLIDWFYAGIHKVKVLTAESNDSLNFSGTGKMKISDTDSASVELKNLKMKRLGTYWVLDEGEIIYDYPKDKKITVSPIESGNGGATFYPKVLKLDPDELSIQGEMNWNLPHPTNNGEVAVVRSERSWLNFDRFTLLGSAKLSSGNQFDLLDPYGFRLTLDKTSDFLIKDNEYRLRANGEIILPEKVKGNFNGNIRIPFPETNQLFYFTSDTLSLSNNVALVPNTGITLHPKLVTFDLSEEKSPLEKNSNPFWKGIYINDLELHFNSFIDNKLQTKLNSDLSRVLGENRPDNTTAWVDYSGMNLGFSDAFSDGVEFNGFPSTLSTITLTIEENKVSEGSMVGTLLIPVFSTTSSFGFEAAINNEGIQPGYLEGLDGTSYLFNEGKGEQEVLLTVTRGVFEDQKLIDMTIDLEWPVMGVKMEGVSAFKAWGDYRLGFDRPNGLRALDYQLTGKLGDYDITIDAIAAGKQNELYSFAISAKAVLGDDVGGNEGPPAINVYTIMPNNLLTSVDGEGYAAKGELTYYNEDGSVDVEAVESEYNNQKEVLMDRLKDNEFSLANDFRNNLSRLGSNSDSSLETDDITGSIEVEQQVPESDVEESEIRGILSKLNSTQQRIVREVIAQLAEELTEPVRTDINKKAADINGQIKGKIDELVMLVTEEVDENVSNLVLGLSRNVAQTVKNDKVDLATPIQQLGQTVASAVITEVNTAITGAVNENITAPITTFISERIAGQVTEFIEIETANAAIAALEGKSIDEIVRGLTSNLESLLTQVGEELLEQISFDNLADMIAGTGDDIVNNINADDIWNRIKQGAENILVAALADQAEQIVGNALNNALGDVIGTDLPIDFATIGDKFKDPDLRDIFALDPVYVHVDVKILSFGGYIKYTADDPTYGDVWRGDMNFQFKIPETFGLDAIYINGKKDDYGYWFCQITPTDEDAKPGAPLDKRAKPLGKPVKMGPAKLMAVSGRFYHHMIDDPEKSIVPDQSNKYGAYLNLIFFDSQNDGEKLRLDVAGEVNTRTNGDYTITFEGNIQILSQAPQINEIDANAAIQGEFYFHYNSAEKHFIGYGRVEIKRPELCAVASVLVDTKPGLWRVEVGNRDDRVIFQPGCTGWAPTGWLMVNQSEVEIGLGLQFSIYAETKTFNFAIVKANLAIDAGIAFGIVAAVQYKPKLALLRAGVWADLWASILINYKVKFKKWKKFSVLDIYARGDLLMIFQPKPSMLTGKLKGHVRLLSLVKIKFDTGFEHEI